MWEIYILENYSFLQIIPSPIYLTNIVIRLFFSASTTGNPLLKSLPAPEDFPLEKSKRGVLQVKEPLFGVYYPPSSAASRQTGPSYREHGENNVNRLENPITAQVPSFPCSRSAGIKGSRPPSEAFPDCRYSVRRCRCCQPQGPET